MVVIDHVAQFLILDRLYVCGCGNAAFCCVTDSLHFLAAASVRQ